MANTRKVVQIFLASPGDLQEERQAAKAVVDAFNKRWAEWLGIQVELVGWEDTFKRWGRPQEQINLDLDRCEGFIGMLWRKWGTPPSIDGEHTSGFEEEFERAAASRKNSARPEMTLFFKKIDVEFLKDQGPDLRKVLSFRERIVSEKLILFEEFDALREFEDKIGGWITRYVQQLKRQEALATSEDSQLRLSDDAIGEPEPAPVSYTPLTSEGARFVPIVAEVLEDSSVGGRALSQKISLFQFAATELSQFGRCRIIRIGYCFDWRGAKRKSIEACTT